MRREVDHRVADGILLLTSGAVGGTTTSSHESPAAVRRALRSTSTDRLRAITKRHVATPERSASARAADRPTIKNTS